MARDKEFVSHFSLLFLVGCYCAWDKWIVASFFYIRCWLGVMAAKLYGVRLLFRWLLQITQWEVSINPRHASSHNSKSAPSFKDIERSVSDLICESTVDSITSSSEMDILWNILALLCCYQVSDEMKQSSPDHRKVWWHRSTPNIRIETSGTTLALTFFLFHVYSHPRFMYLN